MKQNNKTIPRLAALRENVEQFSRRKLSKLFWTVHRRAFAERSFLTLKISSWFNLIFFYKRNVIWWIKHESAKQKRDKNLTNDDKIGEQRYLNKKVHFLYLIQFQKPFYFIFYSPWKSGKNFCWWNIEPWDGGVAMTCWGCSLHIESFFRVRDTCHVDRLHVNSTPTPSQRLSRQKMSKRTIKFI